MINEELLQVLACPKCRNGIRLSRDGRFIVCDNCRLLYEIKDDVPIMLIDSAIRAEDIEKI